MQSQNSKLKTQKLKGKKPLTFFIAKLFNQRTHFISLLFLLFTFNLLLINLNEVSAQTAPSPQTNSIGLRAINQKLSKGLQKVITRKMTAGLGFQIGVEGNPFLMIGKVGVSDGGWSTVIGPSGIDLGEIKIVGQPNFTLASESTGWDKNELLFNNGDSQTKIIASRLTPSILVQNNNANNLTFFSGNVWGDIKDARGVVLNRPQAPSYPKYVAYSSGGVIHVKALSGNSITLPALDNNWLMVWYGNNSHFLASKRIPTYVATNINDSYQADVPLLFVFQNNPSALKHSTEGGVELSFPTAGGQISLMPLLGNDHLKATATESWSTGLPQNIKDKINFWAPKSCNFPTSVSENYAYNPSLDRATITESFTYTPVCNNPAKFAPLPPMMGVAKDAFGANLTFSGALVNANTPTDLGPLIGIDNVTSYSWSLQGLKKYTDYKRTMGTGSIPADLATELNLQVDKIIQGGHWAPWEYIDALPRHASRGDIYFLNPADNLYHLIEIAEALPNSTDPNAPKNKLTNYIKSERNTYPPETVFNLPNQGTIRSGFNQNNYALLQTQRPDYFLKRVSLYNYYSLSRYYELTSETVPPTVISSAKATLDNDLKEQDWASMFWFDGYSEKRMAQESLNRYLSGLIGLSRLSQKAADTQTEGLSRALLAKAVVGRVAFAKYPRYLYAANLVELPTDPTWHAKSTAGAWLGTLVNYNWTKDVDDARQVAILDQFGMWLADNSGFMRSPVDYSEWAFGTSARLNGYSDTSPEVFGVLKDYANVDSRIYLNKTKALYPQWYVSFSEARLGGEHNMSHPIDAYQTFMAEVFLNNPSPDNLRKWRDIPWLESADLFYVHKLAETTRAYAASGSTATPVPTTQPSASVITKPGDIDGNGKVDIFDYSQLLSDFGKSGTFAADLDKSGKVDIFDYNLVLSNFGK